METSRKTYVSGEKEHQNDKVLRLIKPENKTKVLDLIQNYDIMNLMMKVIHNAKKSGEDIFSAVDVALFKREIYLDSLIKEFR